jgi:hypothetical protein
VIVPEPLPVFVAPDKTKKFAYRPAKSDGDYSHIKQKIRGRIRNDK